MSEGFGFAAPLVTRTICYRVKGFRSGNVYSELIPKTAIILLAVPRRAVTARS
jgi:hypothetical protein